MKQHFWTDSEKWLIIADLHLNSIHCLSKEQKLINELKDAPEDYGIIILGDFIQPHYKRENLYLHHEHLMEQLSKRNVIYVKGNNDPDISDYDGVKIFVKDEIWLLEHGHKTPDWFNRIINHFKPKTRKLEPNIYRQQKMYKYIDNKSRYITGHYHISYYGKDGRIVLLPWKLYYFDKLVNGDYDS
jgi:metallophosphoesterase superfamily enzyme